MIKMMEIDELYAVSVDEDYLEHHGVKGMRWGVWNAETRAKYGEHIARLGQKGANLLSSKISAYRNNPNTRPKRLKAAIQRRMAVSAERHQVKKAARLEMKAERKAEKAERKAEIKAERKEQKEFDKETRKEAGLSRREYDKLRDKTLKSHDPKEIAKGMHLLSDEELNAKIDRLEREAKIQSMASKAEKEKADATKARYQAIQAHPVVGIATNLARDKLDKIAQIGIDEGLGVVLKDKSNTYAMRKTGKTAEELGFSNSSSGSSKSKTSKEKAKKESSSGSSTVSSSSSTAPSSSSTVPSGSYANARQFESAPKSLSEVRSERKAADRAERSARRAEMAYDAKVMPKSSYLYGNEIPDYLQDMRIPRTSYYRHSDIPA